MLPSRQRRHERDDEDELTSAPRRLVPGKGSEAPALAPGGVDDGGVAPGKLSLEDAGREVMEPAAAIRYADWIARAPRVDRRAETAGVEDGALATAFGFIEAARGGAALPDDLRARLERELGIDLSNLRVHTGEAAHRAAKALGARAFTIGDDLYFAAGAYDPNSDAGIELISHEVAHVAQQRRGTRASAKRVSRPDEASERSADEFAARFRGSYRRPIDSSDPASLVEHVRREARRFDIPALAELEAAIGAPLGHVEAYVGDAAKLACRMMGASAFAIRGVVAFADESPQRDKLMHELTHIVQMGNRAAPARFALGSLKISHRDDPAEVEARTGGAAPVVHAEADTVHRTGDEEETGTPADRFAQFRTAWIDTHRNTEPVFGYVGELITVKVMDDQGVEREEQQPIYDPQYRESTSQWFFLRDYLASSASWTNYRNQARDNDLTTLYTSGHARGLGLTKGRAPDSQTWAWIGTNDTDQVYRDYVVALKEERRARPDPNRQWREYTAWCEALGFTFTIQTTRRTCRPDALAGLEGGGVYALGEASKFREELFKAVAARYANTAGQWNLFYDQIVTQEPFTANTGLVGNAFEAVVAASLAGGTTKYGSTRYKFDLVDDTDGERYTRTSDGSVVEFQSRGGDQLAIVADCKAYQLEMDGDQHAARKVLYGDTLQQARDYAQAVGADGGAGIQGVHKVGSTVRRKQFNHCVYIFPTSDVSRQWYPALYDIFNQNLQYLSLVPSFDQIPFLYEVNPTFTIEVPERGTHHTVSNPPVFHPGAVISEVDVTLQREGDPEMASGQVTMDMDLGGAVTGQVTKPLQPAQSGGNPTLENDFPDLAPHGLDSILPRVDVSARLVDTGVEATVEVEPGPSGIPGFDLTAAQITASYTEGGLSVIGELGISHESGNLSGTVQASWNGTDWNFEGTAHVALGLVDGLQPFDINVRYENGEWSVGCDNLVYEKTLGAVTLRGTVYGAWYDIEAGTFSGDAELTADLGMFGTATAQAELLARAELSYDSPEFKYPSDSETPSFRGTVGGTITYENGAFSGAITGTANLDIPALQAVAGEAGIGLAVNAQINADGSYGGTVATTTPLTFGDHLEVPSLSCTIGAGGAMSGAFEIRVVDIKYLEEAAIQCTVDATGVHIAYARISTAFGSEGQGQFWGTLSAGYSEASGLSIGGQVNYQIKEGMIARGDLTYASDTQEVSLAMTVDEIALLDSTVSKTLFSATKQIPVMNVWGIGVYLDLGFDLGFDFGFDLRVQPTLTFEGLSLETFEFTRIQAQLALLGDIYARLTGTPTLGLGIFALDPLILRGGGGIRIPIVGEARITPSGTLALQYTPDGGVEGDATVGMAMTFGITGSVTPYAELSVLDGMFNPTWEGDALTSFEILPPKEIFQFTIDLAGDMTAQTPALPESNQAGEPAAPAATLVLPEEHGTATDASGPVASAVTEGPTTPVAETGDEGSFSLAALAPLLEALPGASSIRSLLEKAGEVWTQIGESFGRVMTAFRSFFTTLADRIMEILDGFAAEGLGYLPTLVRMIVGDTVYDIIEPLVLYVSQTGDELLALFETNPPTDLANLMPWVWTVVTQVFGLATGSLGGFIDAVREMMSNLQGVTTSLINQAVNDGWIGVKRHHYYIWNPIDSWDFMAAAEFKLNIPGVLDLGHERRPDILLTPGAAVAVGLYELLEDMGVPVTYEGWNDDADEPYNDRWRGDGARG